MFLKIINLGNLITPFFYLLESTIPRLILH